MKKEGVMTCFFCGRKISGSYDLFDKMSGTVRDVCYSCWKSSGRYREQRVKNNSYVVARAREGEL